MKSGPLRSPRQISYVGISKQRLKPASTMTSSGKKTTSRSGLMSSQALSKILKYPGVSKFLNNSMMSFAARSKQGRGTAAGFTTPSPRAESPFARSLSRDYKFQDVVYSRHYDRTVKNLSSMQRTPSRKNVESHESWLINAKSLRGEQSPGSEIYVQQPTISRQIPPLRSSRPRLDTLQNRFSHTFAPDTARPRNYSPEHCKLVGLSSDKKIRDSFYDNARKNGTLRNPLTHSDIIQTRVTTDQDLKKYLRNIQQRNLPRGSNTGFVYDGECSEFPRGGKGGALNNYMKMQRTQISTLPGSMASNSSQNYQSFPRHQNRLIHATTPEIEAKFGVRKQLPAVPYTARPLQPKKNRYAELMTATTPRRLPMLREPRSLSPIGKGVSEKEMMSLTLGGQTWTTRDLTPSPFALSRCGSAGSHHRPTLKDII